MSQNQFPGQGGQQFPQGEFDLSGFEVAVPAQDAPGRGVTDRDGGSDPD